MSAQEAEGNATILVVEDDAETAQMLGVMLEREGYSVLIAHSGKEALGRLGLDGPTAPETPPRPDLILLDILMEGTDGYAVCERLRQDIRETYIPVILVTALSSPSDIIKGLDCGADDYVVKPFKKGELLARIRAALRIKRLHAERKQAEEALRHLVRFEDLITSIAIHLINLPPGEIGGGVNHALQALGESAGIDRGQVALFSSDGARIESMYGWCATGVAPHIDYPGGMPIHADSWWMQKLRWLETIHVACVAELPPEADPEGEAWLSPAARSVIVIPMVYGGGLIGFLSLSSGREEKVWAEAEINLLKTAAGILASALRQKQAEEGLRASHRRFDDVVRMTGDCVWELDAEGRYNYVSPVIEQVLGYAPQEVLGKHLSDLLPPSEREMLGPLIQEMLHRKEPVIQVTAAVMHQDGHMVILESVGQAVTDVEGNLLGYRGVHRDITAERLLEERLAAVQALGRELVLSRDEQQIAQVTVDAVRLLLQCQLCGLWLVDEEGRNLVSQAYSAGGHAMETQSLPVDSEQGVIAAVARSGEPIYVPDVREDRRYIDAGLGSCSEFCVPLKMGEHVVGVLNTESEKVDAFDRHDQQLLSTLADQAALAFENARLYEHVQAGRDRLRALSHRLVEVQEAERRHIARELHDEVGQLLTGLKLVLEMSTRSPDGGVRTNLEEAQVLINEVVARVRDLSLDLRPAMLDDLGLLPTLLWHFDRYSAQTGVHVAFKQVGLEGRRFAPQVETAAYRIVQEALTNVARHAGAGEVSVKLWASEHTLGVEIEDQGVGFDPEAAQLAGTSSGLSGMQERTALLGGQLTIESAPGVGTRLEVELPLDEPVKGGMTG